MKLMFDVVLQIVTERFKQWFNELLLCQRFRINAVDAFPPNLLGAFDEFMNALWKLRMHPAIFARSRNRNKSELKISSETFPNGKTLLKRRRSMHFTKAENGL